jgi:hypothetical protein
MQKVQVLDQHYSHKYGIVFCFNIWELSGIIIQLFSMSSFSGRVALAALVALPVVLAGSPETCSNPQLSCQNTTVVSNLCCFNAPGGQLLQTQFWDTSPSTGQFHQMMEPHISFILTTLRAFKFVDNSWPLARSLRWHLRLKLRS